MTEVTDSEAVGVIDGEPLDDHAAMEQPITWALSTPDRVEHGDGVVGHVGQRVVHPSSFVDSRRPGCRT